MAITKTIEFIKADVYPAFDSSAADTANAKHPTIRVDEHVTLDDETDDTLPLITTTTRVLTKFVSDGGASTNVSSEDSLVQAIAGAIWS
jgi:hypothetical protein|tara:strand:- start:35 stop:301 length:267 start_codon:yes stop_codon:yes gene_type:complete